MKDAHVNLWILPATLALLLLPGVVGAQMLGSPLISTSQGGIVSGTYVNARIVSATYLYGNGSNLTGVTGSGDNLGNHTATQALNLNSNNLTGSGNITFSGTNPSITSGGSYITIPYGAYFSGGTTYFQTNTNFRSGISNDTAANLVINGGTSSITNFTGNVGIGTATPNAKLDVSGAVSATQLLVPGTWCGVRKAIVNYQNGTVTYSSPQVSCNGSAITMTTVYDGVIESYVVSTVTCPSGYSSGWSTSTGGVILFCVKN